MRTSPSRDAWPLALLLLMPLTAGAVTFTARTPISGDTVAVVIVVSDVPGGDAVAISLSLSPGQGDLLGLFGNVTDESALPQMAAVDPSGAISQWQFEANSVEKVGPGNTMTPVDGWDWGLRIGAAGGADGPVDALSFQLTAPGLTAASILDASNQGFVFGVRVQSTSGPEGSSKIGLPAGQPPDPSTDPPTIQIESPQGGATFAASPAFVSGSFTGEGVSISVNGVAATITDSTFLASVPLVEGANTITATATNAFGSDSATISVSLQTTPPEPPSIVILSPTNGTFTNTSPIEVSGTMTGSPEPVVTVAGIAATVLGSTFSAEVPLVEGFNSLTATAVNSAGSDSDSVGVTLDHEVPSVTLTQPADGTLTTAASILVRGFASDDNGITEIRVNGLNVFGTPFNFLVFVPLLLGDNTITAQATDAAGNAGTASVIVTRGNRPTIAIGNPTPGIITADSTLTVSGQVTDANSVSVNGNPATLVGQDFSAVVSLVEGVNTIMVSATNPFGTVNASVQVSRDTTPPQVTVTFPTNGGTVADATVIVRAVAADPSPIASATINGLPAELDGAQFIALVEVTGGTNTIVAEATDLVGNTGSAQTQFTFADPPTVEIEAPADGENVVGPLVTVRGGVTGEGATVEVNGVAASVQDQTFSAQVLAVAGSNTLVATATNSFGTAQDAVSVFFADAPAVTIASPVALTLVTASIITVEGTVDDDNATVDVNGVAATLTPNGSGGAQFAAEVPLREGNNVLVATGTNAAGFKATATVEVTVDTTPPVVHISSPPDGFVSGEGTVTVTGMINDLVVGTVNAAEASVTVNGISADVANRSFYVEGVPLQPGANTVTAVGTDQAGNTATSSVVLEFDPTQAVTRLRAVAGGGQIGIVGTVLPQPIVVEVIDAAEVPVPGTTVVFRVKQSDGELTAGGNTGRSLVSTTDSQGRAQATFTLGMRSGAGVNRAEVSSPDAEGLVVFTATATAGVAHRISADGGSNQSGVVGGTLPLAFVALVTDAGGNPVAGVPVVFTAVAGGGSFEGAASLVVPTDDDGRAAAYATLGPEPGVETNVYEVDFTANPDEPLRFAASAQVPGDPAQTSIRGVVLDNVDEPIQGVTVSIEDGAISTVTDSNGQFEILPAPVGMIDLVVDGSTGDRPGTWPSLHFELLTAPGVVNTVGRPIYLLPLTLENGLFVDGTTGGTLTTPQIPGFSLTVAPGSVTFPDGGDSGLVSVTLVRLDKVPMAPVRGEQPGLVVTLQPAGALFDPPAPVSFPNVAGMEAGEIVEFFWYDHDLERFASIGPAAVSEDRTEIRSLPGSGVTKGGWGYPPRVPAPPQRGSGGKVNVEILPRVAATCVNDPSGPATPPPTILNQLKLTAFGGPGSGTFTWNTPKGNLVSQRDTPSSVLGQLSRSEVEIEYPVTVQGLGLRDDTTVGVEFSAGSASETDELDIVVLPTALTLEAPRQTFFGVNTSAEEIVFFGDNPVVATVSLGLAKLAVLAAGNLFEPCERGDGFPSNAFQHGYWTYLMARDPLVGSELALFITDIHENYEENRCDFMGMDLSNNRFGVEEVFRKGLGLQQAIARLQEAARGGEMVVIFPAVCTGP